jgi:DNA-binding beta-propeller fold protein YncE
MYISPDDRLLLADRDGHQIMNFDLDGTLLSTIGNRQRPGFQRPFNHPTDVASGPNGDLYVADGYGNSTVHVFSPDGEWKQTWGRPGKGPGEFTTPHAIRVHRDGRVLVVDRENGRIQAFSPGGEYLSAWGDLAGPMDLYAAPDGMVFVTDHVPRLSMFGPDGTLLGRCKGPFYGAHGVWGDSQGNLFQAEMEPMNCLVKLTRIE